MAAAMCTVPGVNMTSVVNSKGRLTLPAPIRKAFNIGTKNRRVRFELCRDGSVRIYPMTDALSLQGVLAGPSRPYDSAETETALHATLIKRKARPSLYDRMKDGLGCIDSSKRDLATNPKHLKGLGRK